MTRTQWHDLFNDLNNTRTDGYFLLPYYFGRELQEQITIKDGGFFAHIKPADNDSDTPETITLWCFNRTGAAYAANIFIIKRDLIYMERKTGFLYNDIENICHFFRHSKEIETNSAYEIIAEAFKSAQNNINKIFQQSN